MPTPRRPKRKSKPPNKSLYTPAYDRILKLLRQTRQEAGLSQEELAARLGRKQVYVSRCELGERRVDLLEWLEFMLACRADLHPFLERVAELVELPRQS